MMKLHKDNIEIILNEMTLDEKIHLCVGGKGFQTLAIDRLGIPALNLYDGHNGMVLNQMIGEIIPKVIKNMPQDEGAHKFMSDDIIKILFSIGTALGQEAIYDMMRKKITEEQLAILDDEPRAFCISLMENIDEVFPKGLPTCFPSGMAMGATWNPELIGELAQCVGMEAENFEVDVMLGPNVNIHRDPLGGRNFESYSEDPYLSSKVTLDYIKGLQTTSVAACVKHYVCNNQETSRHKINEIISRRALEEIYFPSFKTAVTQAKSKTIMTAYNRVNDKSCSENDFLITDVLRNTWGFDGVVVSDWNGVYNKVPALLAGSDLEMPGPTDQSEITKAVENGKIPMGIINDRARRVLELVVSSRHFVGAKTTFDKKKSQDAAYKTATEAMVLLKNDSATLPIANLSSKIALFGSGALLSLPTGEGSAGVSSDYVISSKEGLYAKYSDIIYYSDDDMEEGKIESISNDNEYAIIHVNKATGEGRDLENMLISQSDKDMIINVSSFFRTKGKKTIVLLNVCGPVEIQSWSENVDSILLMWYSGQELGRAIADIICGDVNPSGRLPITFPKRYMDAPTSHTFPGEHHSEVYGEGIFVGYRYYDYKEIAPAYEFGYGLSYSQFEYSNIQVDKDSFDYEKDTVGVSFDIVNTSDVDGYEIPQLYVEHITPRYRRPIKELKAFDKVFVEAHKKVRVSMQLQKEAFAFYDTSKDEWVVQPSEYVVHIGSSSRDIHLLAKVKAIGKNPYALSLETTIKEVYANKEYKDLVAKHIPQQLLDLPGIHMELIYHPELTLRQAWNMYFASALKNAGLGDEAVRAKLEELEKDFATL